MQFTAAAFAAFLSLTSAHVLRRNHVCYALGGETCTALVLGQKDTGKQVCTSVSGSDLIVNYPAVDGYPYSEVHVYLGSEPPSSHAPGQFPFTSGNGYCHVAADGSTATCTIPIAEFGSCGSSYYIATHSAQRTETGWGQGECISSRCKPWAMYWGPLTIECPPCSTSTPPAVPSTSSTPVVSSTPSAPATTSSAPATSSTPVTSSTPSETPSYPATASSSSSCSTPSETPSSPATASSSSPSETPSSPATTSPSSTPASPVTTSAPAPSTSTLTTCIETTTSPAATPSMPACWMTCWQQCGVSSKEAACSATTATECINHSCSSADASQYNSWLQQDCPVSPQQPSMCESSSTPAPVITSTSCPKTRTAVRTKTYYQTSYTTTVLTNVVTMSKPVTRTYTVTSSCPATITQAPVAYTTTCAA